MIERGADCEGCSIYLQKVRWGDTPEAYISGNPELYKSVPHKSRSQIAYLDEWRCDRVVYQIRHGIIQDTSGGGQRHEHLTRTCILIFCLMLGTQRDGDGGVGQHVIQASRQTVKMQIPKGVTKGVGDISFFSVFSHLYSERKERGDKTVTSRLNADKRTVERIKTGD